jgi:hypothetical protein
VYYLTNAPLLLNHWDLGWHLAAGDLIRTQGSVPFHDPWSFTSAGRQWFNLSWLWDVFASALFEYGNFIGLIFFVVACGAVIAGYLASVCLSSGASPIAVCISVLSACLLYPAFAAAFPNIYLAVSPNVSTMVFSVIFYGECLKKTAGRFLLPAMMVLWANLHGGFLLGLIIVGVFFGMALLRRDWANVKTCGFVAIGCAVATLINPLGWNIYQGAASVLGYFSQAYITEWWPYYRNIAIPGSIPGIIYILTFIALEVRYRRGACPAEARLLSWLFLFVGFYQFRYMSFFFLFSTVPLAFHLDRLLPKRQNDDGVQETLSVAGILLACALPVIYLHMDPALGLPQMLSEQDVRYLQTHSPHARLLNHWNYGGLLIFHTRGALPVFVDGRASTAYPDDLLRDYFKLVREEFDETAWNAVLEKYRIDTVLWVRAHDELRRFLVGKKRWREAHTGSYASVYVKP